MTTNNKYPFTTKAQIKARLDSDADYALQALVTLYDHQTPHEQETLSTQFKNRVGFMSSHAVVGSKLAVKIKSGETLTDEEHFKALSIISRYSRQLAQIERNRALEANPNLAQESACFFTVQ